MGCSGSKPRVDLRSQFKLMKLAQSEGLYCTADVARQAILDNPGMEMAKLFEQLRDSLRPLNVTRTRRDPRQMSSRELISAASSLTRSEGTTERPVPLEHLDANSPPMLPADLPASLLDVVTKETCAICASELVGDEADLPIRQLPCSHAFHAACIDIWLTEQAGNCPLCMAVYPRPEYEKRAQGAYEAYQHRMANGGLQEIEEHRRTEEDRLRVLEEEERARDARLVVAAIVPF
jgi:hypothetical protein